MTTYTIVDTATFTVTNARHMAAKVATDLKRMQRFYGKPDDSDIAKYEREITLLIKAGYLDQVTYGFKREGRWIEPTICYKSRDLGDTQRDDDPGRIKPGADISAASFASYLSYSPAWHGAAIAVREAFARTLPLQRVSGEEPGITGYLSNDLTYSSGGRQLLRSCVRALP
jgi:hypothetical protein